MSPARVLLFLLGVLCLLAVLGIAIPKDGLVIGDALTLRFPSPMDLLHDEEPVKVDISDILAVPTDPGSLVELDTTTIDTATVDTTVAPFEFDPGKLAPLEERIALHYPNGDKSVLHGLFAALEGANAGPGPIRVMHYGDSQLEGDRITSYLRSKVQTQFGGSGPGMVAVADIVPSFSVDRILSDNWIRFSVMGRKHPSQTHERFGAMSSFSRFTPILPDTVAVDSVEHSASVTFRPLNRSYGKARTFSECRLFYGWHRAPLTIVFSINGEPVSTEVVQPSSKLLVREWKFPATPAEVTITFTGADSPDVFGVSLESRSGVAVDNIAARGGAGYEFRRADQALLRSMYADLNVKLLILQYGGNVLPNLKSVEEAAQFGRYFGAQIARFKKLIPGVAVIVIGPSDMSIKEGEDYVTRPYLEEVRDALKTNALAQGAVFWDMYEAMGGRNSMVSWVTADPPLAATDYTHFSPQGARKVGELFYTALINDFALYHAAKTTGNAKKENNDLP